MEVKVTNNHVTPCVIYRPDGGRAYYESAIMLTKECVLINRGNLAERSFDTAMNIAQNVAQRINSGNYDVFDTDQSLDTWVSCITKFLSMN
jgi:hypothetical protein